MIILITGATSGHGRYLAERLSREHTVLLHGREVESQLVIGQESVSSPRMEHLF